MGENKVKKIFFVASEAQPFFASGGLGDVIGSLPKRILKNAKGEFEVSVILPLYAKLNQAYKTNLFILDKPQQNFRGEINIVEFLNMKKMV